MIKPLPATLTELSQLIGATLRGGDGGATVTGVHTLDDAGPNEVSWLTNPRHSAKLSACRAAAIICSVELGPTPMPALACADPEAAIARVLERFAPAIEQPAAGVHATACVAADARLGDDVSIGANVWVGAEAEIGAGTVINAGCHIAAAARIGRDCMLHPNVYVGDRCVLGDRVIVKPGAVIGSDGFGFIFRSGMHRPVPQIGVVIVEDDVQIGANTCVDRAKTGATTIGRGAKIDNLVQVAHNCKIGPLCILVGQVGLSGSVRLGAGAVLGGQSGIADGISVVEGARIGAQSGVIGDLTVAGDYLGSPAQPTREALRQMALDRRMPDMAAELKSLRQRVIELERAMHDRNAE